MSTPAPNKALRPNDVEYLFRAIKTDLSTVHNRLNSLREYFAGNGDVLDHLDEANQALLSEVVVAMGAAQRTGLNKCYPHRAHAGELEY